MNGSARCLRGMPLKVCSTTGTILVQRLWNSAEAIRKSKLCSFLTNKFENAAYPAAIRKLQGRSTQPHRKHTTNIDSIPKYFQLRTHGCSCATIPLNWQILARTMMGGIITSHSIPWNNHPLRRMRKDSNSTYAHKRPV